MRVNRMRVRIPPRNTRKCTSCPGANVKKPNK
jgi:hypothetical protein